MSVLLSPMLFFYLPSFLYLLTIFYFPFFSFFSSFCLYCYSLSVSLSLCLCLSLSRSLSPSMYLSRYLFLSPYINPCSIFSFFFPSFFIPFLIHKLSLCFCKFIPYLYRNLYFKFFITIRTDTPLYKENYCFK